MYTKSQNCCSKKVSCKSSDHCEPKHVVYNIQLKFSTRCVNTSAVSVGDRIAVFRDFSTKFLSRAFKPTTMVLLKTFTATLANVLRRTAVATPARTLHQSAPLLKVEDRKAMLASLPGKDEGTIGERSIDIDSMILKYGFQFNL